MLDFDTCNAARLQRDHANFDFNDIPITKNRKESRNKCQLSKQLAINYL
jgi:hypothetical protein